MTKGYVAEQCAYCNHAKGDHKSSGSLSLIVNYGVCLIDGCDCTAFSKPQGDRLNVLAHCEHNNAPDVCPACEVQSLIRDRDAWKARAMDSRNGVLREQLAGAVEALREVRAMVAVLHLDAKERILDTIDAAIRGQS